MSWLGKVFLSMKQGPERINSYFRNAVKVYTLSGEEASRVAALTAAKVAARQQRASMVAYLRGMTLDARREPEAGVICGRLEGLADDITAKDWSIADIRKAKLALRQLSPEYLTALNRFDAQVFERRWPTLFEETPSEALQSPRAKLMESGELTLDQEAMLRSPGKLQDALEIPHEAMQVVGAYATVLADDRRFLKPLSTLPYPKASIEQALQTAMRHARDPETRRDLQSALSALQDFIADDKVPADPEENAKAWLMHRPGRWP